MVGAWLSPLEFLQWLWSGRFCSNRSTGFLAEVPSPSAPHRYSSGLGVDFCLTITPTAVVNGRLREAGRRPSQLRLWFSSFAYVPLSALPRIALSGTELAQATCGSIRLKLLKLGARVTVSVRRIEIAIASACPYQAEFALAHARLSLEPHDCRSTARATCPCMTRKSGKCRNITPKTRSSRSAAIPSPPKKPESWPDGLKTAPHRADREIAAASIGPLLVFDS